PPPLRAAGRPPRRWPAPPPRPGRELPQACGQPCARAEGAPPTPHRARGALSRALTMGHMTASPGRRVLLAAPRGYCAGVDRAVIAVEKALEQYRSEERRVGNERSYLMATSWGKDSDLLAEVLSFVWYFVL